MSDDAATITQALGEIARRAADLPLAYSWVLPLIGCVTDAAAALNRLVAERDELRARLQHQEQDLGGARGASSTATISNTPTEGRRDDDAKRPRRMGEPEPPGGETGHAATAASVAPKRPPPASELRPAHEPIAAVVAAPSREAVDRGGIPGSAPNVAEVSGGTTTGSARPPDPPDPDEDDWTFSSEESTGGLHVGPGPCDLAAKAEVRVALLEEALRALLNWEPLSPNLSTHPQHFAAIDSARAALAGVEQARQPDHGNDLGDASGVVVEPGRDV